MANDTKTELKARLDFHRTAATKLREAYLALVDGGVQMYTIGSRSLTKFDIAKIAAEIEEHEKKADELAAVMAGRSRRRAMSVVPRDW